MMEQFSIKARDLIASLLGLIVTIFGFVVILLIAMLEGFREVHASNSLSGKLLNKWRIENNMSEQDFPQEKVDYIIYLDDTELFKSERTYYFKVLERNENGDITKWTYAYDAGIAYVFGDVKFYILTIFTIIISLSVSIINYIEAREKTKDMEKFQTTLKYYASEKKTASEHSEYLSEFCMDKTQQKYEEEREKIVVSANLKYNKYINDEYDLETLEPWQRKRLKKIKKIKVMPLVQSDLLQESGESTNSHRFLPVGENEHKNKFILKTSLTRTLSSALSGLIVVFGVVIGNWALGIAYGFIVLSSFVSSRFIGTDYTINTLRNRYIAKGDYLKEFNNVKHKYIKKHKDVILLGGGEQSE